MGDMPHRVQLSRRKGWKLPANTVVVARPTKWGNPFRPGTKDVPDVATAVARYRQEIAPTIDASELRGKNLACWCPLDGPCHADVLLELANRTIWSS